MAKTETLHIRIEPTVKQKAEKTLFLSYYINLFNIFPFTQKYKKKVSPPNLASSQLM